MSSSKHLCGHNRDIIFTKISSNWIYFVFYVFEQKLFSVKFMAIVSNSSKNSIFQLIILNVMSSKEVQIVYRLFLVNCYLLHSFWIMPSQLATREVEWLIELAWQYIAMTRNNLCIISISLMSSLFVSSRAPVLLRLKLIIQR